MSLWTPRRRTASPFGATAIALISTGCQVSQVHIEVHASLQDGQPLAGIEIAAVPFDPDRILDSLTLASSTPRPSFPELEAELRAYRRPAENQIQDVGTAWRATRDSVRQLADSLNAVGTTSPGYARAYARLREQYRRLAQRAVERDVAFFERIGDDSRLAVRAAAAADSLRAWEQRAYAAFPAVADFALRHSGRSTHREIANEEGIADFALSPGPWWFIARTTDPNNPFSEYYWSVPAVLRAVGPIRIPLDRRNTTARWRY